MAGHYHFRFDSSFEAIEFIGMAKEIAITYGFITLCDLLDLRDLRATYRDNLIRWTSEELKTVDIERTPDGRYCVTFTSPNTRIRTSTTKTDNTAIPLITDVIFNDPATIVLWGDGTKTVVKCSENDIYDPEKGLAMAISKKALGNNANYYKVFKKYILKEMGGRKSCLTCKHSIPGDDKKACIDCTVLLRDIGTGDELIWDGNYNWEPRNKSVKGE